MTRDYTPLTSTILQGGAGYRSPGQVLPSRVTPGDSALAVMTDLRQVPAVITEPGTTIEAANAKMIRHGVRLLLVVDEGRRVLGLITANDILGEKPMQFSQATGAARKDILVRDIMTPQERLEVLLLEEVQAAKVGHIVATLRRVGRQHATVVERDAAGRHAVCGLFSATQIARQLGVTIQTTEVARTFAEIELALSRG